MKFKIKDDKNVEPEVVVGLQAGSSFRTDVVLVYAHPANKSGPVSGDFMLRIEPDGVVKTLSGFRTGKDVGFEVDSRNRVIVEEG